MKLSTLETIPISVVCVIWIWVSVRTASCLRIITRGKVRVSLKSIRFIKVVATAVAGSNIVGFLVSLGAPLYLSFLCGGLVVLFAWMDKAVEVVPSQTPNELSSYAGSWSEYRRLRKRLVCSLLVPVGVMASLFPFVAIWGNRLTGTVGYILFVPVAVLIVTCYGGYVYYGWQLATWSCPRCGTRFRGLWSWPWLPRKCHNCGLPRWAATHDAKS